MIGYGVRLNPGPRIPERVMSTILKFIISNMKNIDKGNLDAYKEMEAKLDEREMARQLFYASSNGKMFKEFDNKLKSETSKSKIVLELFRALKKKNILSRLQNLNQKYGV